MRGLARLARVVEGQAENWRRMMTQARASSRTLKTSCSLASRIAEAGTDATAIVWPVAAKTSSS